MLTLSSTSSLNPHVLWPHSSTQSCCQHPFTHQRSPSLQHSLQVFHLSCHGYVIQSIPIIVLVK
ncbi:hypothetical protein E2C01_015799 [Portunus trituberculatus]|uniref:Uncharacterized protein n=1 Tax=Portunus trituberculatus TaxID=210409 RepID=A0A5B7DP63_PORTR|nr:hypothetical protein [Portunus trituberculatus]